MRILVITFLSCLALGCGKGQKVVSYHEEIQPILNNHCVKCHGTEMTHARINLTSYATLMQAKTLGSQPLIVPEKPAESWLYNLAATSQSHFRMPPDTTSLTPLPQNELELIARWIQQGAKDN